jgi:hypothetical protein
MSTIELTGLSIASPIGFTAALGLLRVCNQDHGQAVELSWSATHARLHGVSGPALAELLAEHMRGRAAAREFNLEVTDMAGRRTPFLHLRSIPVANFRAAASAWRGDQRALGFLAGYGTDAVVNDEGCVSRSSFDFSSARQCLAQEFRLLAAQLDPSTKKPAVPLQERIRRALYGGPYEAQHSFGWDPATLLTHAHQAAAPTDSATPGQPLLIWLAVESLPLHPVVATASRYASSIGFAGRHGYVWPQWSSALTLPEVRLLRQRPPASLDQLIGVDAVWMSGITSVGKFRFFQPAARTASDRLQRTRFARADLPG